jgi:tetratricopeptide (TPR) repeat protein
LTINEELNDQTGKADTYQWLGNIAKFRGQLDDADEWYRKSLTINKKLQIRPGMAMNYGQLALLAEDRGDLGKTLEWMVRCIALFPEFPSRSTGPAPQHLRRLTHLLGIAALEQAWRSITDTELPARIHTFVETED